MTKTVTKKHKRKVISYFQYRHYQNDIDSKNQQYVSLVSKLEQFSDVKFNLLDIYTLWSKKLDLINSLSDNDVLEFIEQIQIIKVSAKVVRVVKKKEQDTKLRLIDKFSKETLHKRNHLVQYFKIHYHDSLWSNQKPSAEYAYQLNLLELELISDAKFGDNEWSNIKNTIDSFTTEQMNTLYKIVKMNLGTWNKSQ